MTTAAIPKPAAVIETAPAAEPDDFELTRPLSVNISPHPEIRGWQADG